MKIYLRTTFVALALLVGLFTSISCQTEDANPIVEEPKFLEENLLESQELFTTIAKSRLADHVFVIEDIQRSDNILKVKVKGGGSEDSFQFIWDGLIRESSPEGIQLMLVSNNAKNDFDKDKEFELTTNLQKIIGNERNTADFHFSILNGSQRQDTTLNPDGTVSNE